MCKILSCKLPLHKPRIHIQNIEKKNEQYKRHPKKPDPPIYGYDHKRSLNADIGKLYIPIFSPLLPIQLIAMVCRHPDRA